MPVVLRLTNEDHQFHVVQVMHNGNDHVQQYDGGILLPEGVTEYKVHCVECDCRLLPVEDFEEEEVEPWMQ